MKFLMRKLNISLSQMSTKHYVVSVKRNIRSSFVNYWKVQQQMYQNSESGKLDLYFKLKDCFNREKYLELPDFNCRQSIAKIRLSAHTLKIETGRYGIHRLERTQRICDFCDKQEVEDEVHFVTNCPLYSDLRKLYFKEFQEKCKNFVNLSARSKFLWLFENMGVLISLGYFISKAMEVGMNRLRTIRSV